MCPLTSLRMITLTAKCNIVISGWVWSLFYDGVRKFEKNENDQNHGISGGRAYKNVGSTICYWINYLIRIIIKIIISQQ